MEEIIITTPTRPRSFYVKRVLGAIILLALAGAFLFSAYTKIISIRQFEWAFEDMGFSNPKIAAVLARVFIGIEAMIGLFLLAHIYLKKITYPIVITFLMVMNFYLVYLIAIRHGNSGNCGCFGNTLYMTPIDAILKNLGMIVACIILIYIYPVKPYKSQEYLGSFLVMACIALPLIINPLNAQKNARIDLSPLYASDTLGVKTDLREGKHLVAFMSLTCPHCKKAAKEIANIYKANPTIPVYLILAGPQEEEVNFFKETGAMPVPHVHFRNSKAFLKMADRNYVPVILFINNQEVQREISYYELDGTEIKRWAER